MSVALVTGSAGLIGSQVIRDFSKLGLKPVGIDDLSRARYCSEQHNINEHHQRLCAEVTTYEHHPIDVRDLSAIEHVFSHFAKDIQVVVHGAGQPSSEYAAQNPLNDFHINALGTMNVLEATRHHCPQAAFIYLSSNRVYGDSANRLPIEELRTRWEIANTHPYHGVGINENMPLDHTKHTLMGASKASADLMVQEYGQYYGLTTACFRLGSITGNPLVTTPVNDVLSYLMQSLVHQTPYIVYGHRGKQVRDHLHVSDLVQALMAYFKSPTQNAVYNLGGGISQQCSLLEAIEACQSIAQKELAWSYDEQHYPGDLMWWVTDTSKFEKDYPNWVRTHPLQSILEQLYDRCEQAMVETV